MASVRGRGLRPGGVVRALLRLVLFVVVGFGVGLLFGIVTEEPALLAGHLSGEGESVSLTAEQGTGGLPAEGEAEPDPGHAALAGDDVYASSGAALRPLDSDDEASRTLPGVAARATSRPARSVSPRSRPAMPPAIPPASPSPTLEQEAAVPVSTARTVPRVARTLTQKKAARPAWAIQVGAFSNQQAATRLAEGLRNRYPVAVLPADGQGGRWRVRVQPIPEEAKAREIAEQLKRDESLPTWVTAISHDSSGLGSGLRSPLGEGRPRR